MTPELIENYHGIGPREFGLQLLSRLEERWGVDLGKIIYNDALPTGAKRRLVASRLLEAVLTELDEDVLALGGAVDADENAALSARVSDGDVELEPNFTLTQSNAAIIRGYRGQQLYDYVFTLTKRFENMAKAKTPGQLAIEIVSGGLVSVGVSMSALTIQAWRTGETLLKAVRIGVTGIGFKTAITVVIFALAALLLFLLLDNPKKICGILINDTDENLVVVDWRKGVSGALDGDLYMAHGQMKSFPEDHETESLSSPLVQLRKRFFFGPGDPDNSVCASVYFADRNIGLRGSEGVMLLSSKESSLIVAHQFAVPYVNDNGTNMRVISGGKPNLEALFRDMYNSRQVAVDLTQGGYRLTSAVNDARGGVVALIGSITKV